MLSSITWQQYFAAIAIIGISYYLYVLLRYYQREISGLLSGKQRSTLLSPNDSVPPISVMGHPRQDQNVSVVDEQDLNFTTSSKDWYPDEEVALTDTRHSSHSDLIQRQLTSEIDNLIKAYADVDNKSEFLSLLSILINSYQEQDADLQMRELETYILSKSINLPFDLNAEELPIN